jgi:predicted nucleic acid-binding protein
MYAVGAQHPLKAPCLAILDSVATGKLTAVTDVEVLQEILHRYTALGQRLRAVEVAELLLQIVPDALPVTIEDFLLATQLHSQYVALQARDSLHLAIMQRQGIFHIISADRHFDGIPGLIRLDPAHWPAA